MSGELEPCSPRAVIKCAQISGCCGAAWGFECRPLNLSQEPENVPAVALLSVPGSDPGAVFHPSRSSPCPCRNVEWCPCLCPCHLPACRPLRLPLLTGASGSIPSLSPASSSEPKLAPGEACALGVDGTQALHAASSSSLFRSERASAPGRTANTTFST